jgi:predicted N-acyltransferase
MLIRRYESIAEVDPARWDGIARDPFSAHACLAALERSGMDGVRMRYATIEDRRGNWIAAAPFARIPIDAGRLTHGAFRGLVLGVRGVHPGFLHTGLTICGTPLSVGNPPARIARGADREGTYRLLAGLLHEIANEDRSPWRAFKELDAVDVETARGALASVGWILAPSEENLRLGIQWAGFEGYLAVLRSAYRSKLLRERAELHDAGVTVDVLPLAEGYDDTLHRLYEAVHARAAVQFERLTAGFFTALGRAHPSSAFLIRQRIDGRTVGWVAVLVDGEVVYDLFHGIDYEEIVRTPLYFGQLAEVLRFAIERRAAWLSMGQSTAVAKARFGARSVPRWTAIRHESGAVTRVLLAGRHVLFPEPVHPQRNVFRRAEEAGERSCASGS